MNRNRMHRRLQLIVGRPHGHVAERVERGAKYLDIKYPGWYHKVDTKILNMTHCANCILGQLTGRYNYSDHRIIDQLPAIRCGFVMHPCNDPYEVNDFYVHLQQAWINKIHQKRSTRPTRQLARTPFDSLIGGVL